MGKITLKRPELFEIAETKTRRIWGGVQYWYPKKDYIPPGACGATTASNIFGYLARTRKNFAAQGDLQTKAGFLELMKKAYPFLYPRVMGLMADNFMFGAEQFADSLGVPMCAERLKVPICRSSRPSADEAAKFIAQALTDDVPVAFLILSSGAVPELDAWHWVTIIAFDEKTRMADIIDNGELLCADIGRWIETTIMGGSFVRLVPAVPDAGRVFSCVNASIS